MIRVTMLWLLTLIAAGAATGAPIPLTTGPQLFVDDYLIASQSGLSRRINSPSRLAQPLINAVSDHNVTPYLSVHRDPGSGRYRMWYNNYDARFVTHLSYLESNDAINWIRPPQQLVDPSPINFGASVIDDGPTYADPSKRYKFCYWGQDGNGTGIRIATSANGLAFTPISAGPVAIPLNHDITAISRDPLRQRYVLSGSSTAEPGYSGVRIPMQSVSTDLVHWSAPKPTIRPDYRDSGVTQFYGMAGVVARGNLLIANLKVLRDDLVAESAPAGAYGIGYTVLAWSRDGVNWTRDTQPFIDRDHTPGTWDHAMAWGDSQLVVGDQTYIYYGGYAWGHKWNRYEERQIGLAVMGRDRYVSRDAGATTGTLVTPVFTADAQDMGINAMVNGELKARILDQNGQPLPGFGWTDFSTIHGDSVSHAAHWAQEFSTLQGTPIALEFSMTNSRLYGFDLIRVSETLGDFNGDAIVNAADIDILRDRMNAGTADVELFDVNNDGSVNQADLNFEVTNILETKFGDTDTDGDVDLNDLGNMASGFQVPGEKRWSHGNFDSDNDVDLNDLGTLATNFAGGRAPAYAAFQALVPEPACLPLVLAASLAVRSRGWARFTL
jgi:hypothetical protein